MSAPNLELLESIVDSTTLFDTVETLAEICRSKAEHLRSNWQDERAARAWDKAALKLEATLLSNWIRAL